MSRARWALLGDVSFLLTFGFIGWLFSWVLLP